MAPAQANFHNGHVDALLGEVRIGQGHAHLEERGLHRLKQCLPTRHPRHQVLGGQIPAVHLDALGKLAQMRGGVEPHLVARRLQHRRQQVRAAPLAIGAGYVHAPKLPFRVALRLGQHQRVAEAFFEAGRPHPLKHRQLLVEVGKGFGIGHA